jgi:acyl-CoA thioester hydrolase
VRIDDFPYSAAIGTRWNDNDVYGHVNNVEYYAFFDTMINAMLIEEGGLDIHGGPVIGLCAESSCRFLGPIVFPQSVTAALRVAHLGESSVRYEIALFTPEDPAPVAVGWFVHVFVDRETRRPQPVPPGPRARLEGLLVGSAGSEAG